MTGYLLDTNICIYLLKGQFDLHRKIEAAETERCFLSEITVAELKYGAEKSLQKEKNRNNVALLLQQFDVFPIYPALDVFAAEKARLKIKGRMLDDFDLLIGATALFNELTLVTRNTSDFERLSGIVLEDWTIH